LGAPRGFFADRVWPEVTAAVEAALGIFAGLGAEVIEAPWPEAEAARGVGFVVNRVESAAVHEGMPPERLALLGADLRPRLVAGRLIPAPYYLRALRARQVVKHSVARLFREHRLDALLAPTLPATAALAERPMIFHYDDGVEEPLGTGYTRLTMPFNATGQPVLAVPCGFDRLGLPIGLQIAGRPFAEATICRIGAAYEAATEWHTRRPAFASEGR
ncbi:MAG: amidase family protein, partial [Chloroflexota bacterium]|nr:amidase family protein [Chloroflexota bacterium]